MVNVGDNFYWGGALVKKTLPWRWGPTCFKVSVVGIDSQVERYMFFSSPHYHEHGATGCETGQFCKIERVFICVDLQNCKIFQKGAIIVFEKGSFNSR